MPRYTGASTHPYSTCFAVTVTTSVLLGCRQPYHHLSYSVASHLNTLSSRLLLLFLSMLHCCPTTVSCFPFLPSLCPRQNQSLPTAFSIWIQSNFDPSLDQVGILRSRPIRNHHLVPFHSTTPSSIL